MNRNDLIKYIVLNSDLSLEEMSQSLGVNRSNIYLWRKGKTKPKKNSDFNQIELKKELQDLINAGLSLSQASSYLAKKKNLPKKVIYNIN